MAKTAFCLWELNTGGTANNAGGFDPSLTASMDAVGSATSANTASPIFTSANYSFVAGDVNAYVYIALGTNWISGWYQIASVAGGNATLTGACASVASPSAATWTVDYSRGTAAKLTVSDGVTNGTTLVTSVTGGFTVAMIANAIYDSGTATDRYLISNVPTANHLTLQTATADTGVSRTIAIGGALGSADVANTVGGNYAVNGNYVYLKYNVSTPFTLSSSQTIRAYDSVTTGRQFKLIGYSLDSERNDHTFPVANKPTLQSVGNSTFNATSGNSTGTVTQNIIWDQNNGSGTLGTGGGGGNLFIHVDIINTGNNSGFAGYSTTCLNCTCTCSSGRCFSATAFVMDCVGTVTSSGTAFFETTAVNSVAVGPGTSQGQGFHDCTLLGAVAYSFQVGYETDAVGAAASAVWMNCIASTCATGYKEGGSTLDHLATIFGCAFYSCTTGVSTNLDTNQIFNGGAVLASMISCPSGDPFVNAASSNFTLSTAGKTDLKAQGYYFVGGYSQVGYPDIGVYQHQDTGGGGSGMLYIPNLEGI